MKKLTILSALLLVLLTAAGAQKPQIDTEQQYLLLATKKTSTMQKELNEAAAQGFVIQMGSPTSGNEMALFLERTAEPPDTYTYQLLATSRTGTMQKELAEAAEEGFRLLPRTMISKKQIIGGVEVVVVLERPPNLEKRYQYKLLATKRTSTLQKEVAQAQAEGYVLVGMVSRGEHMVIMEKGSPADE